MLQSQAIRNKNQKKKVKNNKINKLQLTVLQK